MYKKLLKVIFIVGITGAIVFSGAIIIDQRLGNPPKKQVNPKKELLIHYTNSRIPIDTLASVWEGIEWTTIQLFPQSARSPYGYSEKELRVKAISDEKEIAFLLQFNDATEDRNLPANPDACAILFATNDSPETVQMMGYGGGANVWQWLADRDTERFQKGNEAINPVRELIASGPGTQTPFERQNVMGKGLYQDGKWSVIMKRSLKSDQEGESEFKPGVNQNIAFALWNGSKMEGFSRKSISIMRTLILEKR